MLNICLSVVAAVAAQERISLVVAVVLAAS
jgi:hypothetical protein